jgi:hypothetical protein
MLTSPAVPPCAPRRMRHLSSSRCWASLHLASAAWNVSNSCASFSHPDPVDRHCRQDSTCLLYCAVMLAACPIAAVGLILQFESGLLGRPEWRAVASGTVRTACLRRCDTNSGRSGAQKQALTWPARTQSYAWQAQATFDPQGTRCQPRSLRSCNSHVKHQHAELSTTAFTAHPCTSSLHKQERVPMNSVTHDSRYMPACDQLRHKSL